MGRKRPKTDKALLGLTRLILAVATLSFVGLTLYWSWIAYRKFESIPVSSEVRKEI